MGSSRMGLAAGALAQLDMNLCAAQNRAAADEALNAAYGALVKEPSMAERLDKLRAAERSWVAFRDAECAFEGSAYEGGSMQPMVIEGCAEALTKRRTAELTSDLACARDPAKC